MILPELKMSKNQRISYNKQLHNIDENILLN
jgi:hypothetical protein